MSLSWFDPWELQIHSDRVILRRPGVGEKSLYLVRRLEKNGSESTLPLALLAAAGELLQQAGLRFGRLRVVVADHLVRYTVLPWSPDLLRPSQRREMALSLLKHALGEQVQQLEIAVDSPAYGCNGLAMGMDRELLQGLRQLAKARHLQLLGVQPNLLRLTEQYGQSLQQGCLLPLDQGWLALLAVKDGDVHSICNHRIDTRDRTRLSAELSGLLRGMNAAVDSPDLYVFDALRSQGDCVFPSAWRIKKLVSCWGAAHASIAA